jgi:hypothetical protein
MPPSLGNGQAQPGSLQEAVTILAERVQSEAGVEQLMGFLTASSSRQTPEELGQMLHEIRVSQPATAHQKNERFPGAPRCPGFPQALTIRKPMR